MLENRGAFPKEDGYSIRGFKAMHEDNFLKQMLRKDAKDKAEEMQRVSRDAKEEGQSGKGELEGRNVQGRGSQQTSSF